MTGADAFAVTRYETALQQFQAYVGDPVATIDEALQASPSFISGHLLKALVLYTLAERKFVPMAGEALAAAKSHARFANDRERGLSRGDPIAGRRAVACRVHGNRSRAGQSSA